MRYRFSGGVHPPTFKTLTCDKATRPAFIPTKAVIALSQHVGSPAEPIVAVGDKVALGQLIAKATGLISSPVHASLAGKVTAITYFSTPLSPRVLSVVIESAGESQEFIPSSPEKDVARLSRDELLAIIRDSGMVGLGGAAFPTYVKLSPPKGKKIDTLILNGAECEPYLTCDYRLMLERADEILKGLEIMAKILGVKDIFVAIEDNKPEAIKAMERASQSTKIVSLATKYPQGAEKQVIKAVLNRVVPAGGLPIDVGCVVQNVQTALAVYEAVYLGKPLIERTLTLSGACLREPANIRVRIGTLLSDLVEHLGGLKKQAAQIVFGGPMMGVAHYSMEIPIIKGTSGCLLLSEEEIDRSTESVCIRCGKCLEICPMNLVPTTLMYLVKNSRFSEAKEFGIGNCFECGACAYGCPAKIQLLDYMKYGKSKI